MSPIMWPLLPLTALVTLLFSSAPIAFAANNPLSADKLEADIRTEE
jgi:hypothetical protein